MTCLRMGVRRAFWPALVALVLAGSASSSACSSSEADGSPTGPVDDDQTPFGTSSATTSTGVDTEGPTSQPINCGDGELNADEQEQCDDGNTDDGDGCSSWCQLDCSADNEVLSPGGGCYRVYTEKAADWQTALTSCRAIGVGYDLAALASKDELEKATEGAPGSNGRWVGGHNFEEEDPPEAYMPGSMQSGWSWVNGEVFAAFEHQNSELWHGNYPLSPDEHRCALVRDDGQLQTNDCGIELPFVCEIAYVNQSGSGAGGAGAGGSGMGGSGMGGAGTGASNGVGGNGTGGAGTGAGTGVGGFGAGLGVGGAPLNATGTGAGNTGQGGAASSASSTGGFGGAVGLGGAQAGN